MSTRYSPSQMWQRIAGEMECELADNVTDEVVHSLNRFLAVWEPETNALRYARLALYATATAMTPRQLDILRMIGEQCLSGSKIEVTVAGTKVNFDYLQAALEVDFMAPILSEARRVAEIGAGYGRTCHTVVRAIPHLESYTIVDLPGCLRLSQAYLKRVLSPQEFTKLRFVSNEDVETGLSGADLVINIDSMAEMDADVARNYLDVIDRQATGFYAKNPVGKYDPAAIGVVNAAAPAVTDALVTGLLRDVVDIFDSDAIAAKADDFIAAYKPSPAWQKIANAPAPPWSHYHQALYRKQ